MKNFDINQFLAETIEKKMEISRGFQRGLNPV